MFTMAECIFNEIEKDFFDEEVSINLQIFRIDFNRYGLGIYRCKY